MVNWRKLSLKDLWFLWDSAGTDYMRDKYTREAEIYRRADKRLMEYLKVRPVTKEDLIFFLQSYTGEGTIIRANRLQRRKRLRSPYSTNPFLT